jgi:protein-S-isoprenylcysteine O-methyltransferase Ste14
VQGRIRHDPATDAVTLEVRTSGLVFKLFLAVASAVTQGAMFALVLFGIAGTSDWARAWVFIAVWSVNVVVVCVVSSTEVMIERLWPIRDLRRLHHSDAALLLALGPVVICWIVLIPLDRFHLELTSPPPALLSAAGLCLVVVGWVFITLATRQNRFASPLVKLQDHQSVVDTGVYGIVRHPMYLGGALFVVGLPLWLESYAAIGLSLVFVAGLAVRIGIEERLLRELDGYKAYTERVQHRLVPFLW